MAHNAVALSSHEEKRQHPRFPVKLPLDYWETPEVVKAGFVGNISETGLLMYSVHRIEIGTNLGIRVYFLKDNRLDCIEGNAKIVWSNLDRDQDWVGYRYGVHIMQMPPDYYDKLMNYLLMLHEEEISFHSKRSSDGA